MSSSQKNLKQIIWILPLQGWSFASYSFGRLFLVTYSLKAECWRGEMLLYSEQIWHTVCQVIKIITNSVDLSLRKLWEIKLWRWEETQGKPGVLRSWGHKELAWLSDRTTKSKLTSSVIGSVDGMYLQYDVIRYFTCLVFLPNPWC